MWKESTPFLFTNQIKKSHFFHVSASIHVILLPDSLILLSKNALALKGQERTFILYKITLFSGIRKSTKITLFRISVPWLHPFYQARVLATCTLRWRWRWRWRLWWNMTEDMVPLRVGNRNRCEDSLWI